MMAPGYMMEWESNYVNFIWPNAMQDCLQSSEKPEQLKLQPLEDRLCCHLIKWPIGG